MALPGSDGFDQLEHDEMALTDLAVKGDTAVATGWGPEGDGVAPFVFTRDPLGEWHLVELPESSELGWNVSVVATETSFVATGGRPDESVEGDHVSAVWVSNDGIDWRQADATSLASALIIDVAGDGHRVVASEESGEMWYSDDDGETWLRGEVESGPSLFIVGLMFDTEVGRWLGVGTVWPLSESTLLTGSG